jgi:hypothetical protein
MEWTSSMRKRSIIQGAIIVLVILSLSSDIVSSITSDNMNDLVPIDSGSSNTVADGTDETMITIEGSDQMNPVYHMFAIGVSIGSICVIILVVILSAKLKRNQIIAYVYD